MTCRRSPCTFSSRVIGRSSQSGPLQGVVTLGTIGQMALTLSGHKCQHYSDSVQTSVPTLRMKTLITRLIDYIPCVPAERPADKLDGIVELAMRSSHVSVLTAVRLSATFTYVTPVAHARDPHATKSHLADGGYQDNFGVATGLARGRSAEGRRDRREGEVLRRALRI